MGRKGKRKPRVSPTPAAPSTVVAPRYIHRNVYGTQRYTKACSNLNKVDRRHNKWDENKHTRMHLGVDGTSLALRELHGHHVFTGAVLRKLKCNGMPP